MSELSVSLKERIYKNSYKVINHLRDFQILLSVLMAIFFLFTSSLFAQTKKDLYSPSVRWQFAKDLYEVGDFEGSELESRQLLGKIEVDPTFKILESNNDSLRLVIAKSCFKRENWESGFITLSHVSPQSPEIFAFAKLALNWKAYDQKYLLEDTLFLNPRNYDVYFQKVDSVLINYRNYLELVYHLQKKDWQTYEAKLNIFRPNSFELQQSIQKITPIVQRRQNAKNKSAIKASLLSFLVPGLGQAYMGRWGQAITVFMTSGVLFMQAYEGHYKNSDLQKYTFTALFTGYHSFSTYNAGLTAQVYNRNLDERYQYELAQEVRTVFRTFLWN